MTKHAVTKAQLRDVSGLLNCIDRSIASEWSNIHYGSKQEMITLRAGLQALLYSNGARSLESVEHASDSRRLAELEAINKQLASQLDQANREAAKAQRDLRAAENNIRTLRATNHHHGRGFQCVSDSRARIAKLCDERFKALGEIKQRLANCKADNEVLRRSIEKGDAIIVEHRQELAKSADRELDLRQLLNNANHRIADMEQKSNDVGELSEQVRDLTHENIKLRQQREDFTAKYAALDVRYDNALQGLEKAERTILALAEVLAGKPSAPKAQEKKVIVPFVSGAGESSLSYVSNLNSMLSAQGFTIYRGTIEDHTKDSF